MISPLVQSVFLEAAQVLRPPPKLTICDWAERERILSSESSAEPGRYRAARAPYQRGMQDAILDPLVEEVVFFTSAQVGKSLCLENILGYFMAEDPCPIIWLWQSLDRAREWSAQELSPMLRDTPALTGLVDEGARKSRNATLFKSFPGGSLNIAGANSPGGLRARKARVMLLDEVDAYPASAGPEGDPVLLITKRSATFWNRKRVLSSTCTLKGSSRIEAAYEYTNRQKYWVPCPHCSEFAKKLEGFQVLKWKRMSRDPKPPHTETVYPCEFCAAALTEFDKPWMLANGEWRAEDPTVTTRVGFWINEMYSPFVTWAQMTEQFLNAMHHRENPELLKTFVNLSLGETWEDRGEMVEPGDLLKRREPYPPPALPDGVTVLTAGVDVQADRIELEVVGYGKGEESWGVDWQRFDGDPARAEVWDALDKYLLDTRFLHARGVYLEIAATFVDSGYRASDVYSWTQSRNERRIFASKGMSGFARAPLGNWNRNNKHRVKMYPVAVDVIKEKIYARLRIREPGAGYMHFSEVKHTAEFFQQLTAERLLKKYRHGFPIRYWELPAGTRNEVLDMRVLAHAAFLSLATNVHAMLDQLRKDLLARAKQAAAVRRARVDPRQLALLQDDAAEPAGVVQTPAQPAPPAAAGELPESVPGVDSPDPGLGADEYKIAEQIDAKAGDPGPPPARIKFVRSPWL